jgi:hypothetical protein
MIRVTIRGEAGTSEYEAAAKLRDAILQIPQDSAEGEVLLLTEFMTPGENVSEIDIVVFGVSTRLRRPLVTKVKEVRSDKSEGYARRVVDIKSFIGCIEIKNQLPGQVDFRPEGPSRITR